MLTLDDFLDRLLNLHTKPEKAKWNPKWTITKFKDEEHYLLRIPQGIQVIEGNLLLDEGVVELLKLLIGETANSFNSSNARIGIGNSSTAAASNQTGLLGTSKLYKGMEPGYPKIVDKTAYWRSFYGAEEANFIWNEITVANGSSDTAKNLNRKIDTTMGTKAFPEVWLAELSLTIS